MEFTVTKEQILELANWANPDNEKKLREWFPKAFETQLEVGKWYKSKYGERDWIMNYQGSGSVCYGFNSTKEWSNTYVMHNRDKWTPATTEEVESVLIAEAKKKGYLGKNIIMIEGLKGLPSYYKMSDKFSFKAGQNQLMCDCGYQYCTIFKDGIWAEILPEEKIIITHEKALKIIAKKLKVSHESIEIQ